jgi:hypothetical protein
MRGGMVPRPGTEKAGMSAQDEAFWRGALERKGKDWVLRELQTRAGQPMEPLLDVVYEEPHPTREFCQRWCAEQENRMIRFSGLTLVMIGLIVALLACGMLAVNGWDEVRQAQKIARMR